MLDSVIAFFSNNPVLLLVACYFLWQMFQRSQPFPESGGLVTAVKDGLTGTRRLRVVASTSLRISTPRGAPLAEPPLPFTGACRWSFLRCGLSRWTWTSAVQCPQKRASKLCPRSNFTKTASRATQCKASPSRAFVPVSLRGAHRRLYLKLTAVALSPQFQRFAINPFLFSPCL